MEKDLRYKKGFGGAVLMDLSKAFDTRNHDQNYTGMVSVKAVSNSFLVIQIIDGIRQGLTRILVHGKSYSKGFLKDLSLVVFYSIFI